MKDNTGLYCKAVRQVKYFHQYTGLITGYGPDRMTDGVLALPHLWTY